MSDFLRGSASLALALVLLGFLSMGLWGGIEWAVNGLPRERDRVAVAIVVVSILSVAWTVAALSLGNRA